MCKKQKCINNTVTWVTNSPVLYIILTRELRTESTGAYGYSIVYVLFKRSVRLWSLKSDNRNSSVKKINKNLWYWHLTDWLSPPQGIITTTGTIWHWKYVIKHLAESTIFSFSSAFERSLIVNSIILIIPAEINIIYIYIHINNHLT